MHGEITAYRVFSENLKERHYAEDLGVDGTTVLVKKSYR
jgi:hypothetical protein